MKIVKLNAVQSHPVDHPEIRGATKQVPIGIADGAPNFSMRVFTLEPGGYTPYHQHPWEHENYVLNGSGVMVDGQGNHHPIEAGDFAIVVPNEMHQFRNTSQEPLQFICLVPKEYE